MWRATSWERDHGMVAGEIDSRAKCRTPDGHSGSQDGIRAWNTSTHDLVGREERG